MLINDIRSGARISLNPEAVPLLDAVMDKLNGDEIVCCIQNVADYFYQSSRDRQWTLADFPSPMPIAPLIWYEWKQSDSLFHGRQSFDKLGCFSLAGEPDPGGVLQVQLVVFCQYDAADLILATGSLFYWLLTAPEGCEVVKDQRGHYAYDDWSGYFAGGNKEQLNGILWGALYPVLLANSFSHCKNVTTIAHEPDAKLQRARTRRQKPPLARYYTLNIEPMKQALRSEGGSQESGLKKAMHICRGHFARYSAERPLFGRHAGSFWIPAHVRGSKDVGVIKKAYNVKGLDG